MEGRTLGPRKSTDHGHAEPDLEMGVEDRSGLCKEGVMVKL